LSPMSKLTPKVGRVMSNLSVLLILPVLLALLLLPLAAGPARADDGPAARSGSGADSGADSGAGNGELREKLSRLLDHGGVAVGKNGTVVFQQNPGRYVPASIIKLATALAALNRLGPDYRFETEVFVDQGRLYIRGHADPFLVSEEWVLLASALEQAGAFSRPLDEVILDESALVADLEVDGAGSTLNPYDAPLGALVANFNTVNVRVQGRGSKARVESAEPQTPLTPLGRRLAGGLPPGTHRINLAARGVRGIQYAGELAVEFFRAQGAKIKGLPRTGRVPPGLKPLLVYRNSRPLTEVVRAMMEFSNNFIANSLVLALGQRAVGDGRRVSLADGVGQVMDYLLNDLGLKGGEVLLTEGSGLSRRNHVGLEAMLRIVDEFYPWRELLKPYGKPPYQVPAKTGTLTGVYSLAGYLPAPEGERRPFVIILNQERHVRGKVFGLLARSFSAGSEVR